LAMPKTAISRAMCGQIYTGRGRMLGDWSFFRALNVKRVPNAIALRREE
jgi:hypothetical protein